MSDLVQRTWIDTHYKPVSVPTFCSHLFTISAYSPGYLDGGGFSIEADDLFWRSWIRDLEAVLDARERKRIAEDKKATDADAAIAAVEKEE